MVPTGWGGWSLVILLALLLALNLLLYTYNEKIVRFGDIWNIVSSEELKKVDKTEDNFNRWPMVDDPPPGHMGKAVEVNLSDRQVASLVEGSIKLYGFNEYAASLIPLRRSLPDLRDVQCLDHDNDDISSLPKTSIVIVFFNEPWSVLARTVHSVLDNTPGHLIQEIVLVDDCSILPHLKTRVEEYFRSYSTVRILRAPKRMGLIRARLFGAKNTTAPLLTFLDAHVECTKGWLHPLLREVVKNDTTIAVPLIDRIDDNDMHLVRNVSNWLLGAFQWDLNFGWWYRSTFPRRTQPRDAPVEPFETPAMAGGIFTIARRFFAHLGWYDEQFQVYGMENSELSIKCWMCGGKILTVPCAHVTHIRKRTHPFVDPSGKLKVTFRNSIRLARVWMDEYAQIVYDVNGVPGYSEVVFGSVEERLAARAGAGCRAFRYYLERAYPEMPNPNVPGAFRGEVHSAAMGSDICLTTHTDGPFMAGCDKRNDTQFWTHNFYQELNSYKQCIDVETNGTVVKQTLCHRMRGSQAWFHDVDSAQLRNIEHGKCLTVDLHSTNKILKLEPCSTDELSQKWNVTLTKYEFWNGMQ